MRQPNPKHKRRALGQHFLRDPRVIDAIVKQTFELIRETPSSHLVEIGPGQGALTDPILMQIQRTGFDLSKLVLIEKDREFAARWETVLPGQVYSGDALDWIKEQKSDRKFVVVSNLPYSSGTAIFNQLAESPRIYGPMVLMFQREVADRIASVPGTKSCGSLSIWTQNRWDAHKILDVPPRAFAPPPKVHSAVLVLSPRLSPRITGSDARHQDTWEALLARAFHRKRRMLRGNLISDPIFSRALERSGIDGTKRAETLSWDEWECLFNAATESVTKS